MKPVAFRIIIISSIIIWIIAITFTIKLIRPIILNNFAKFQTVQITKGDVIK